MQMSLGLFIFTLPTVVFQDMKHKRDVRYARNERVGNIDSFQFVGPGELQKYHGDYFIGRDKKHGT